MKLPSPSSPRRIVLASAALASAAWLLPLPAFADSKTAKPWLGVSMTGGPAGGVLVDYVFKGSPAAVAKLEPHDMLVSADGVALDEPRDLVEHVQRRSPGMTVKLRVRRGGRERKVQVELARHPGSDEIHRLMYVGESAPTFVHPTAVQGQLPALTGGITLVDFFASWCTACRTMSPRLSQLHKKYQPKGLNVVGMTSDTTEITKDTIAAWKIAFPVGSDDTQRTNAAYKVTALPAVFLVDRKGVIRDVMIGYAESRLAAFEKQIEKLLAKR